ncbi:MAG: aminopeptidase P family protein [Thermoplasmata archaeon]|nr:aminopeptidase P family protein [Thermoplasmata archaeon]
MVDYKKRWDKVINHLVEKEMDAFIISSEAGVRYLCCSHVPLFPIVTSVVVTKGGTVVGTAPTLEEFRAEKEAAVQELRIYAPYKDIPTAGENNTEALQKLLEELKVKNILTDTDLELKDIEMEKSELVADLRTVKDPGEIKAIREAIKITRIGEDALPDIILPGKKEVEAAAELDLLLRRNGAQCNAFPTIVASGEHASYSHHDPSQRKIGRNETVIVDFGVYFDGYCSDMTRTLITGPNKEMEEIYNIVAEAHNASIRMVRPGVVLRDIDERARAIFREHGNARYFVHSIGHGMGLKVHENVTGNPPSVNLLSDNKAVVGNVFTIEPGLYFPGKGGVRIEDDILVTEDGHEVLSR